MATKNVLTIEQMHGKMIGDKRPDGASCMRYKCGRIISLCMYGGVFANRKCCEKGIFEKYGRWEELAVLFPSGRRNFTKK